jgi:hypothetical protein
MVGRALRVALTECDPRKRAITASEKLAATFTWAGGGGG